MEESVKYRSDPLAQGSKKQEAFEHDEFVVAHGRNLNHVTSEA